MSLLLAQTMMASSKPIPPHSDGNVQFSTFTSITNSFFTVTEYKFNSDGSSAIIGAVSGGSVLSWYNPVTTNIGNAYQIRVTRNSGDPLDIGPPNGVWVSLDNYPANYSVTINYGDVASGNFTVSIRNATTLSVVGSHTFNMSYI